MSGSIVAFEVCVSLATIIGFFLLSDLLWQRNRLYYIKGEACWTSFCKWETHQEIVTQFTLEFVMSDGRTENLFSK